MSKQTWDVYVGTSCTTLQDGLSDIIDVFVPELTPNAMGEPTDHKIESSVIDEFTGAEIKTSVIEKRSIKASFFGRANHFIPCIHKGEQVLLIHHGGGDLGWYWYPMGRLNEHGIRRFEHVRWFIMDQPKAIVDGEIKDCEDANTFFIDMNTNPGEKRIQIHTSRSDGEPVGYDMHFIPEAEMFYLLDTKKNIFSIDSKNTIMKMINADKSMLELNKTNINLECAGTFHVKAGTSVVIDTPTYNNNGVNQTHKGTSHTRTMTNISDTASAGITTKGATVGVDGAVTFTGPKFTVASASGVVPVVIIFGSNAW